MSGTPTIAVLGAGAFGTGLAAVLARAGRAVVLVGRDASVISAINSQRKNPRLPAIALPSGIEATTDLSRLRAATLVLVAIPTQSLRAGLLQASSAITPGCPVVICAKGIEQASSDYPHVVAEAASPAAPVALLSGPGFAADIAKGLPTAMTLAMDDAALADGVARQLSTETFRLYASTDRAGVAAGGALKNVMAIASGIVIGRGLGESARAAIIARGLAEIGRFAEVAGGRAATVSGLSGLGDLVLTATSAQSRNYRFGLALGGGGSAAALLAYGEPLAEGAWTASVAARIAVAHGFDAPLAATVAAIIEGGISADEAMHQLLARPLKREHD
jgi:glycerol-3-phosphate dehydrogenase (NAD(P)+)